MKPNVSFENQAVCEEKIWMVCLESKRIEMQHAMGMNNQSTNCYHVPEVNMKRQRSELLMQQNHQEHTFKGENVKHETLCEISLDWNDKFERWQF